MYNCDFCGKAYSDPSKYVQCVQTCSENVGKKAAQIADLEKQIKHHFDEYRRLSQELYELDPSAYNTGKAIHVSWPNVDLLKLLGI